MRRTRYPRKKVPRRRRYQRRFPMRRTKATGRLTRYRGPRGQLVSDTYMARVRYTQSINVPSTGTSGFVTMYWSDELTNPSIGASTYVVSGARESAGIDEFKSLYTAARVLGMKVSILLQSNTDSSSTGDAYVQLMPVISTGNIPSSVSEIQGRLGRPESVTKMLTRYGNGGPVKLTLYYQKKRLFGQRSLDDEDFVQNIVTGTPPARQMFIALVAQRADGTAAASPGFHGIVNITYYVKFEQRRRYTQGTAT